MALAASPRAVRVEAGDELADAELVERLGDAPGALAAIYRRHGRRVFGAAAAVIGDDGLAAEISQEVFLRLWREPARFDASRGSLAAFLCMQARRRAIDVLRADQARRRREVHAFSDFSERSSEPSDGAAWRGTWGAHIRSVVSSLDPLQREPIELAFFGGYTYREVAELLGQPEGTIKSRIRIGLRALGAAFGGRGAMLET